MPNPLPSDEPRILSFDPQTDLLKTNLNHRTDSFKGVGVEKVVVSVRSSTGEGMFRLGAFFLAVVTGQAPQTVFAAKSLAQFRVRKGDLQESLVTLRGTYADVFLDRLNARGLVGLRDFTSYQVESITSTGAFNTTLEKCGGLLSTVPGYKKLFEGVSDSMIPPIHIQVIYRKPLDCTPLVSSVETHHIHTGILKKGPKFHRETWELVYANYKSWLAYILRRSDFSKYVDGPERELKELSNGDFDVKGTFYPSAKQLKLNKQAQVDFVAGCVVVATSKYFPVTKLHS
jgi:hypothetical protein